MVLVFVQIQRHFFVELAIHRLDDARVRLLGHPTREAQTAVGAHLHLKERKKRKIDNL